MEHRTRSPASSSERWPHLKTTALHRAARHGWEDRERGSHSRFPPRVAAQSSSPDLESAAPVRREMDVVISAGARVAGGLPTRRNQPNQSHRSLDVIFHGKARRFAVLQTIALPTELPRRGTQFSWFCSG